MVLLVTGKMSGRAQIPIGVINPVVIRTNDTVFLVASPLDELVSAMPAGVVERMDLARRIANEEDRVTGYGNGVTGPGDLVGPSHHQPGPRQPARIFQAQKVRVGVDLSRQTAAQATFANHLVALFRRNEVE